MKIEELVGEPVKERAWWRAKEVMARLGISSATLHRWRHSGAIESKKVEGVRFFNLGKFEAQLEQEEQQ